MSVVGIQGMNALGPVFVCAPQTGSVSILAIHLELGPFLGGDRLGYGPTDPEQTGQEPRKASMCTQESVVHVKPAALRLTCPL